MLDRLEHDEKDPQRPRRELDNLLEVDTWGVLSMPKQQQPTRDPSAPAWWRSDEDASQSFLRAMGVM